MNTLLRNTLLAAMIVLPTAAFAQSVPQVDETQVETIAYEVIVPDSAPAPAPTRISPVSGTLGTHANVVSDTAFNPAADAGLNSIYVRH
ncbi:hypothetical protein P3T43_000997 [Paraburkholderia sp. GAS41]|jgi:hypothetical protein|uniref:hypothetical protein n=1 Tax=Paraburkholderia sp. GAS41 TaxID=3035134 RepID=UPI003D1AE8C6